MNDAQRRIPTHAPLQRLEVVALACMLIWAAGGAISHRVGIWTGVGGVALALGVALVSLRWSRLSDLLRPTSQRCGVGLAAGGVMVAATYLIYPIASGWIPAISEQTTALYTTFSRAPALGIGVMLPLVIVCEELVWRGAVQEAAGRRFGPAWGVALAALASGLASTPVGSPLLLALALACGLYWGALRALTGSLVAPLVCHFVWDLCVFALAPLARPAG